MTYYNTLDMDKIDKQQLETVITKIKSLPCCVDVTYKDSSTKGYHVLITCTHDCNTCRFVFDDQKRFEIDLGREPKFQNTTFDEKEYFRGNMTTIKHHCDRCAKYAKHITLSEKTLTMEQTKIKMKMGKIRGWDYRLVYLGYVYLECPVCGWFKFVKKSEMWGDKLIDIEKVTQENH